MSVGPGQREVLGQNLREPERGRWPDNGRIEIVVDPNWLIDGKPRVVRKVGWRTCMTCKRRMFSPDMSKIRICDQCKDVTSELTYDRMRERVPAKRPRRPRYTYQFQLGNAERGGGNSVPRTFEKQAQSQDRS